MQSENGQCLRAGFDRAFGVKGMAHSDPALQGLGVGEGGEGGGGVAGVRLRPAGVWAPLPLPPKPLVFKHPNDE